MGRNTLLFFTFPCIAIFLISKLIITSAGLYNYSDLVATYGTDVRNAPMIDATRPWRTNIRTHIIVDQDLDVNTLKILGEPYGESFTVLPNFPGHPAVLRTVLAPLFAFEALGQGHNGGDGGGGFKWLLVGDADTVFVPHAVLQLLNGLGLSAEEPHMITDFLVDCDYRSCRNYCPVCKAPLREDPRCLPCKEGQRLCPCKLPAACAAPVPNVTAGMPPGCPLPTEISAYGGAGIIYSIGLLREIFEDPSYYAAEALRTLVYSRPYSDVALAELARLRGYGFTRLPPPPPPRWLKPGMQPTDDVDRQFSYLSYYNDRRSPREQLTDLLRREQDKPGSLERLVSFHVHTWSGQDFASVVLPPYRAIVRLLLRQQHRRGREGAMLDA